MPEPAVAEPEPASQGWEEPTTVQVPTWDDDPPLAEKLAPFPGAQIQITIPERAPG